MSMVENGGSNLLAKRARISGAQLPFIPQHGSHLPTPPNRDSTREREGAQTHFGCSNIWGEEWKDEG